MGWDFGDPQRQTHALFQAVETAKLVPPASVDAEPYVFEASEPWEPAPHTNAYLKPECQSSP